jgi:hypothetical protein
MFYFGFKSDRNNGYFYMKNYIRIYKHLERKSLNIYYSEKKKNVSKETCRELWSINFMLNKILP